MTSRTDVGALIPETVSRDLISRVVQESATLALFRRVPVAGTQVRFPVISALPVAYWVSGDTGLKQTTEMAWANKYLNIEEIAAIVPVPENVAADLDAAGVDIWAEVRPALVTAIGEVLDQAVFFGTNAPGTFPTNVNAAAAAAGNSVTEGATVAQGGIADSLDEAIGLLETDGYDPNGVVASRSLRGLLRRLRDTSGQRIVTDNDLNQYDGMRIVYPMRGMWPTAASTVRALVGDWSQFIVGVRQDISFKILDQAVIQDNTGAIIYNLPQQDMIALRVTFRAGWQVANTLNKDQPVEANRYPAARIIRAA